jgi:hypothetical protein
MVYELLSAIYDRTGAFEQIPYSGFETFLAHHAGSINRDPNGLRRICFDCAASLDEEIPHDERMPRRKIYHSCIAAANRSLRPLDAEYPPRLKKRSVEHAWREADLAEQKLTSRSNCRVR